MPDPTPPIEQQIAPGDDQFDPSQLDDAGLQAFLGLTEPTPDNPDPTPGADENAAGDAAADQALESALAEPEPAKEAAPVTDETPKAGAEQEAPKADAKVAEKKSYVVYGQDGKPLDEVPVKEVEITVNGSKKRVDLDRLARMAASGGYNEVLQEEVRQAREAQSRLQALEAERTRLAQEREAILKDPDYYLKQVERYAEEMSPEARARRAEEQLQQVQSREQQHQAVQYVQQQAETVILPRIQDILAQHPQVTEQEILAQFTTLIQPYRPHGGMIAPQHVPAVLDVIDRAIAPWAAQLHDARDEQVRAQAATKAAQEATAKAEKARKDAEAKASKAKAEVSRTIAPVGRVAARPAAPKAPAKTANEGADRALEDAIDFILNNPSS